MNDLPVEDRPARGWNRTSAPSETAAGRLPLRRACRMPRSPRLIANGRAPPSNSTKEAVVVLHRSRAVRAIKSNTGCGSPGEADIALSTSIVAD